MKWILSRLHPALDFASQGFTTAKSAPRVAYIFKDMNNVFMGTLPDRNATTSTKMVAIHSISIYQNNQYNFPASSH